MFQNGEDALANPVGLVRLEFETGSAASTAAASSMVRVVCA